MTTTGALPHTPHSPPWLGVVLAGFALVLPPLVAVLCRSCRVKGSASPSPTPGSSLRSDCGLWSALDPPSAKHHAKRLKTAYSAFSRPNPARMYPEARKTAPRASCGRSCASLPLLFHCQAIAGCLRGRSGRARGRSHRGPGAARPTSRSALGAGCKPVFGGQLAPRGPRFAGRGAAAKRWGCPVPWHASSVEVAHRPGLGSGFFCWFFLVFLVFLRAREDTPQTRMDKGFQAFLELSQSCLFFRLSLTFFRFA